MELLVVIAIIGVLVSLLLPAVQSARESARRTQCTNNMRQVVMACHMHHDLKQHLPHGTYNFIDETGTTRSPYNNKQDRRSWAHDILPFMEQGPLYERFDSYMAAGGSALNFPDRAIVVPMYICASDPNSPKRDTFSDRANQGFSGNFVACAGDDYFNPTGPASSAKLNGVAFAQSQVVMTAIKDGTSNTAMISEIILSPDVTGHDIRGRYYNPAHCGTLFSTRIGPNTMTADQLNWCTGPVKRAPCVWQGTNIFVSARSYHPGGINMAMCDGATRFITSTVDVDAFKALGSRNGGEPSSAL